MTLKYESEILFDLMKRDGDDTPSDVLPYESELKEKYLQQVEGGYPKLQDYRSEWLNYNLIAHLPADFPVETLSNVTSATVDNVVPYAYRSAILKGQTLVNVANGGDSIPLLGGNCINSIATLYPLKTNTKMLIKFNSDVALGSGFCTFYFTDVNGNNIFSKNSNIINGNNSFIFTTPLEDVVYNFKIYTNLTGIADSALISNLQIFEYQDGMENWEIPYFEGMQSVKMPVLTTNGKNLMPINSIVPEQWSYNILNHKICDIKLKPNTTYTFSNGFDGESKGIRTRIYDGNNTLLAEVWGNRYKTFTTNTNENYWVLAYALGVGNIIKDIQIEEGAVKTAYEPYKSNILSTPEDLELRGIGDIKDELNLMTGELTQRIGEVVLDGSDSIEYQHQNTDENTLRFFIKCFGYDTNISTAVPFLTYSNIPKKHSYDGDEESIFSSWGGLYIRIAKEKLTENNVKGFKLWLSQNPITVQYQLATESIKTVDLTVIDQDGNTLSKIKPIEGTMHLSTSGTPIKPTFNGEITVEATTQNLDSFIEE